VRFSTRLDPQPESATAMAQDRSMVRGVLVLVVILLLVIVPMYNRLVRLRNRPENALGPGRRASFAAATT
jgi:hypothetical protein